MKTAHRRNPVFLKFTMVFAVNRDGEMDKRNWKNTEKFKTTLLDFNL
jgi:hypothetical protein